MKKPWTFHHIGAAQLLKHFPLLPLTDLKSLIEKPLSATSSYYFLHSILECPKIFKKIDGELKKWHQNYTLITPFCSNYPSKFKGLNPPPPLLFVLGQPTWNDSYNLAVVGRREARPYTLNWMETELYAFLKNSSQKINLISGGARGVDQKAHKAALMFERPTTVVVPSGLNQLYPKQLHTLKSSIVKQQGCFISCYLPDTPMHKKNFHYRNQLIAALSDSCLILEAQLRSGTYKTASYCQDYNTSLGVVPSFPTDQGYSGSLQLIFDGAQMIRDHKDLFSLTQLKL